MKQTQSHNQAPTPNHLLVGMESNHSAVEMHPTQETPLPVVRGLTSGYRNRSEDPHTPPQLPPQPGLAADAPRGKRILGNTCGILTEVGRASRGPQVPALSEGTQTGQAEHRSCGVSVKSCTETQTQVSCMLITKADLERS